VFSPRIKASEAQLHVSKSPNATKQNKFPLFYNNTGKRDDKREGGQSLTLFISFLSGIIAANHF